jgi:hypothetical protein
MTFTIEYSEESFIIWRNNLKGFLHNPELFAETTATLLRHYPFPQYFDYYLLNKRPWLPSAEGFFSVAQTFYRRIQGTSKDSKIRVPTSRDNRKFQINRYDCRQTSRTE